MKTKIILLVCFIFLSALIYAQNSMRDVIRGEKGISKHDITLNANQQVAFNGKQAKAILGLDADCDLLLTRSETDALGQTHYRYTQTFRGIPVEDAMYIVHIKNGKATGMSGEIIIDFSPDLKSALTTLLSVSKQQAINTAIQKAGAKEYTWQDPRMEQGIKERTGNSKATLYPTANLVWFSKKNNETEEEGLATGKLVLAYKVDVFASNPLSRAYYYIDAQTGQFIAKRDILYSSDATGTANTYYSGSRIIHSDLRNGKYRLRDYTKGNGVITLRGELNKVGFDYTSPTANWSLSGATRAALDAHFGVSSTYNYYKKIHGRNSYDDAGAALYSYVNYYIGFDNAYWDGYEMVFYPRSDGIVGGLTGIDVCGHELTHAVTEYSCALVYANESGAMNESLSDIMGKNVQFYTKPADINWELSNDMGWIIRDMSNPNLQGQPDTYKGDYWYTGTDDNGGVHYNSGVGNFMYYLLVNGGTGVNDKGQSYSVTGLGRATAEKIVYRCQTVYLFSTAKYIDWRTAAVNAAIDLFGAGTQAVRSVKNAFHAVGIGAVAPVFAEIAAAENAQALLKSVESKNAYVNVMPNPVQGSNAQVNYKLVKSGKSVLRVVDVTGRTMQYISLGSQDAGTYIHHMSNAGILPKGTYFIVLEQNGRLVSRNIFIVER